MSDANARRLIGHATATPWFMQALRAVRSLDLADWCIGAGAVRNLVWDALHDRREPSPLADIDVAYFDGDDPTPEHDNQLLSRLRALEPAMPWDVTNQAGVHLWFERHFGHPVAPLRSLEEAVASWPEYATAVGLSLDAGDRIAVVAPFGLDDLFSMTIRRNPTRISVEAYRARVASKRHAERWPMVRVVPC